MCYNTRLYSVLLCSSGLKVSQWVTIALVVALVTSDRHFQPSWRAWNCHQTRQHHHLCGCQCQRWLLLTILSVPTRAFVAMMHQAMATVRNFQSTQATRPQVAQNHYNMINTTWGNSRSAQTNKCRNRTNNAVEASKKFDNLFTIWILGFKRFYYIDERRHLAKCLK